MCKHMFAREKCTFVPGSFLTEPASQAAKPTRRQRCITAANYVAGVVRHCERWNPVCAMLRAQAAGLGTRRTNEVQMQVGDTLNTIIVYFLTTRRSLRFHAVSPSAPITSLLIIPEPVASQNHDDNHCKGVL